MLRASRLTFYVLLTIIALIPMGYNIYLLTSQQPGLGARFAYFGLGLFVFLAGHAIHRLQRQRQQLQAQIAAQLAPGLNHRPPPQIVAMTDRDALPALTPDQLHIMQQLFKDDYRIRVDPLEGGKTNCGIFRIVQERKQGDELDESGYVVKYLEVNDIRKEIGAHQRGGILDRYPLRYTPGRFIDSWPAGDELSMASETRLGAVAYHLATLEGGSQLQTLTEVYNHCDFLEIEPYLITLFDERLSGWYRQNLNDQGKPLGGLRGEYERLHRNRKRVQDGMRSLLDVSEKALTTAPSLDLSFLPEPWRAQQHSNPLYWILNVLGPGEADCFQAECRYSPIHGDLHTGNVLIERGRDTYVWLVDFPNAHIGPALVDFAMLEADLKFRLIDSGDCSLADWLAFEERLLAPLEQHRRFTLVSPWYGDWEPAGALLKAWQFIGFLRERIMKYHLMGADVRAYYLALLHATLPVVYRDHSLFQRRCALTSAAWMCGHLG
jgi:hypothetical protein